MTNHVNNITPSTHEISIEDRKLIYRARRGLKELDFYLQPYVKHHFLTADATEKQAFALLVEQEDPDLLDWFMDKSQPDDAQLAALIQRIKTLHYQITAP